MIRSRLAAIAAALGLTLAAALLLAPIARAQDADDTARFLAGLAPSAGSEAARLANDPAWQAHARALDQAWSGLERRQLSRIRAWSAANVAPKQATALYMFSGPDFAYLNAFFPQAETYVLAGLEPVGNLPRIGDAARRNLSPALGALRHSMTALLSYSFFITKKMKVDLRTRTFTGTVPLLYVFLARSGYVVRDAQLVQLDAEGRLQVGSPGEPDPWKQPAFGVEITFAGADGKARKLYYFRTDLSDSGARVSGFHPFVQRLGRVDSLIKSASYLFHKGGFERSRQLLLEQSERLVQDDSGVPLQYFKPGDWELRAYGHYLGPIAEFPGRYQARMAELYRRSAGRLDFGIGYRYRPAESNLMVAARRPGPRKEMKPSSAEPSAR